MKKIVSLLWLMVGLLTLVSTTAYGTGRDAFAIRSGRNHSTQDVVDAMRGTPGIIQQYLMPASYADAIRKAAGLPDNTSLIDLEAAIQGGGKVGGVQFVTLSCSDDLLRKGILRINRDGSEYMFEPWQRRCYTNEQLLVAETANGERLLVASLMCLNPGPPNDPVVVRIQRKAAPVVVMDPDTCDWQPQVSSSVTESTGVGVFLGGRVDPATTTTSWFSSCL